MASATMRELLEAGVHFGHQTRRWNPKMRRFIFGERAGIYVIDLQKTMRLLEEAHDKVRDIAAKGGTVLFVGTKKQSRDAIASHTVSPEQWALLLRMLKEHASIDYAYRRAVEYAERAKKPLYAFPPSSERDALLALPDFVLSRDR